MKNIQINKLQYGQEVLTQGVADKGLKGDGFAALLECLLGSGCNQVASTDGLAKPDVSRNPDLVNGFLYPGMTTDQEGDKEQSQEETMLNPTSENAAGKEQTLEVAEPVITVLPQSIPKILPTMDNDKRGNIVEGKINKIEVLNSTDPNASEEVGMATKVTELPKMILENSGLDPKTNSINDGKKAQDQELQKGKANVTIKDYVLQESADVKIPSNPVKPFTEGNVEGKETTLSTTQGQRGFQVGQMVNQGAMPVNDSPKLQESGNASVIQVQEPVNTDLNSGTVVSKAVQHLLNNQTENIKIIELVPKFIKEADGMGMVSTDQQFKEVVEVQSTLDAPSDLDLLQPTQLLPKDKAATSIGVEKSTLDKGLGNYVDQSATGKVQPGMKEEMKTVSLQDNLNRDTQWQNSHDLMQNSGVKGLDAGSNSLAKEVPLTQLPAKLHEMVKSLMVQQQSGQTTLKMKLQPEHLGEVTVKLTWSKGELSAQFVTSSGLAKDALETTFPQLKELLAQQNIRLSEAAVFMGQQSNGQWDQNSFTERQRWQESSQKKVKGQYTGINQVEEPLPSSSEISSNSGLNLVV